MRLAARAHSLTEELLHLADPQERLSCLVDRARHRPRFTAEERTPERRVPGCSSSVWLIAELRDGRCWFRADADSPVVRGLVGLLADFFNGATAGEIAASDAEPLEILDLSRRLTPTRRHGLAAVRAAIKMFAQSNLAPRTRNVGRDSS